MACTAWEKKKAKANNLLTHLQLPGDQVAKESNRRMMMSTVLVTRDATKVIKNHIREKDGVVNTKEDGIGIIPGLRCFILAIGQ